jgi:hypothetical protein
MVVAWGVLFNTYIVAVWGDEIESGEGWTLNDTLKIIHIYFCHSNSLEEH